MKALNLWQPWPWLIFRPDITNPIQRQSLIGLGVLKDIENRPRKWYYIGDVAIVASLKVDPNVWALRRRLAKEFSIVLPEECPPVGGIVGVVRFGQFVRNHKSKWFTGPFGFPLTDPRPIEFIEMKGQQGLYNLKPEYERQVAAQLKQPKNP